MGPSNRNDTARCPCPLATLFDEFIHFTMTPGGVAVDACGERGGLLVGKLAMVIALQRLFPEWFS
jgi:hypothetical protein